MFNFDCRQCGTCCRATNTFFGADTTTYLLILDDDLSHIACFLNLSIKELCEKYSIKNNSINTTNKDCPFLLDNKCSINEVKPLHCKKWPRIKKHSKREYILQAMKYCPGLSLKKQEE